MFVCDMYVQVHMCLCACRGPGQRHGSSFTGLYIIFWAQGPELTNWLDWLARELWGNPPVSVHPALGGHTCHLRGCWGLKLRSSRLCSKHQPSHLVSSVEFSRIWLSPSSEFPLITRGHLLPWLGSWGDFFFHYQTCRTCEHFLLRTWRQLIHFVLSLNDPPISAPSAHWLYLLQKHSESPPLCFSRPTDPV